MEGTIVGRRQRRTTERTRRRSKTLESTDLPPARFGVRTDGGREGGELERTCAWGRADGKDRARRSSCTDLGPGRTERQEGNGHSDVVRLPTRGKPSKGVNALVRNRLSSEDRRQRRDDDGIRGNPANPRSGTALQMRGTRGRRKPSRWWETTRTERDVVAWQPRPEGAELRRRPWSGRPRGETEEGRSQDESQERQEAPSSRGDPRDTDFPLHAGSAESDAKVRRRHDGTVSDRRAPCRTRPRSRHRRR